MSQPTGVVTSATTPTAVSTLVIGYGNPLREDDGVGWAVAERLQAEGVCAGITAVASHQLLPELADIIHTAAYVIFVDATVAGKPGAIRMTTVTPDGRGPAASHQMSPAVLLYYAQELYGRCPPATLITVTGQAFGYRQGLTPLIEGKVAAIVAMASVVQGTG